MKSCYLRRVFSFGTVLFTVFSSASTLAEEADVIQNESIEVIGITPAHGTGLPVDMIPFAIQSATAEDIERSQSLDLSQFLNRNLGSVTINEAQNNPLQPDIQYRGFTSSPLLGLPQGLAVYQDGVRVNEAFGDVVNWDLIPKSSISSINLHLRKRLQQPRQNRSGLGYKMHRQPKNSGDQTDHSERMFVCCHQSFPDHDY